jgi:tRNA (guanine-N7-)-methyltransferase
MTRSSATAPSADVVPPSSKPFLARTEEHVGRVHQRRIVLKAHLAELLPGPTKVVCEVGCGHGHFLTAYAAAHPTETCIGVDIMRDRIARAHRKAHRAKLARLHFMVADASEFLDALPATAVLSSIYVLFPDPWPKRRHHKHRLLQPSFLDLLATRAEEGGRLYFRTDYDPYFTDALRTVSAHGQWRVVDQSWPFELETVFQARAEKYHSFVAVRRPNS